MISAFFVGSFVKGLFLGSGLIRTVNYSNKTHDIKLNFPSGEQRLFTLKPNEFKDIVVSKTGEGSIGVELINVSNTDIGYVTSYNNPILISINHTTDIQFDYLLENEQ